MITSVENTANYFGDLGKLLFLPDAKERLMCMLGAYFDDSGTHSGAPSVAVAGLVSKAEQWDLFSRDWQGALDWFNRQYSFNVRHFHMAEFMAKQKQFKGMNDQQAELLLDKLISFVTIRCRLVVTSVMLTKQYEEIIGDEYRKDCGSPYTLCAQVSILKAKRWAQLRKFNEPMSFIFEDGTKNKGELLEAFDRAKRIRELEGLFVDDGFGFYPKHLAPLQAADLLAWLARRQVSKNSTYQDMPYWRCFMKLTRLESRRVYIDRQRLEYLRSRAIAKREASTL